MLSTHNRPSSSWMEYKEVRKNAFFRHFFILSLNFLTPWISPGFIANVDFNNRAFSGLQPQFEKIERYYREIYVALRDEEQCLRRIYRSLHVTAGDRLRWENIRDACREASTLLTPEVDPTYAPVNHLPPPPPFMPQQTVSARIVHFRHRKQF
jgi:hypothetical protein